MSIYRTKFNPFTKKLQWVTNPTAGASLNFKDGVDTYNDLPITGNSKNDARITNDNHNLYIWELEASSGNRSHWINQGDIININWDSIVDKPSSTPTQIDNIVNTAITSQASGDWKKITGLLYNPTTGDIKVEYEE